MKNKTDVYTIKKFLLLVRSRCPNGLRFILSLLICIIPLVETFSQTSRSAYVGDEILFVVPSPPNNGAVYQSSWASKHIGVSLKSSDTFSATFEIKSYFEGEATIQCDYYYRALNPYTNTWVDNNATAYYSISCKPVTIKASPSSMNLSVSETQRITYSTSPKSVSVNFSSSNSRVATVSSAGYVTAVSSGTAEITLSSDYGPSVSINVTVKKINPTSISILDNIVTYVGESVNLSAILTPSNASSELTWLSEDEEVAIVEGGKVTGVSEGKSRIYVVASNGVKSNDCDVEVKYRTPTDISVDDVCYIRVGDSRKLDIAITPTNARTSLCWTSSDTDIVSITPSGKITALKVGQSDVIVETDNGLVAKCKVISLPLPCYLIVWTSDGTYLSYPLEEHPVIMYDGYSNYIIKTALMQIEYPVAYIERFTLLDTAIPKVDESSSVSITPNLYEFKCLGDVFYFSSLPPNSMIYVYGVNGRMIMCAQTSSDGVAVVDISELPKGAYIVKTNNIIHKIVKI